MRDHLAHRYFDTSHALVKTTVERDLPELAPTDRAWSSGCPTAVTRKGRSSPTSRIRFTWLAPSAARVSALSLPRGSGAMDVKKDVNPPGRTTCGPAHKALTCAFTVGLTGFEPATP